MNVYAEDGEHTYNVLIRAKKILARKANIVLHLIDAMTGQVSAFVSCLLPVKGCRVLKK